MKINGTSGGLLAHFYNTVSGAKDALAKAGGIRGQLLPYQAAALFALAQRYDRPGATILEIGTLAGYSAAIMAQAAPQASIVTLNPKMHEVVDARVNLREFCNVMVTQAISWDCLARHKGQKFDMIFVDGDHKRVAKDLPWWEHVTPGGLMLFHDYSEHQCPPVYGVLNKWRDELGRDFDVCVVDDDQIGMAGFYKEA